MRVLMCGNAKGGAGKTTAAVHLAAGLASNGRRVLLVDLDTQGHASLWLAGRDARQGPGLADALDAGELALELVRDVDGRPGLSLLPGGPALAPAELALARNPEGLLALRRLLAPHGRRWDVAVLDTPPHVGGVLTLAALVAADAVLGPFVPGFLALDGLGQLEERLAAARELGSRARLLGYLAVAVDGREGISAESLDLVKRQAPGKLLRNVVRVSTAQKALQGRRALAWDSGEDERGAEDWRRVLAEVEARLEDRPR
jgi:chromosome partitioning protein